MIDPKELRIGNWYNFANPLNGGSEPQMFSNWTQAQGFVTYGEPIPLTLEVIERWCGFRNEGLTYSGYVFLKEVLSGFRLEQYDDYFMFSECGEDKACASRLKYLHQLQNAYYFLSNWQELEVNVPAIVA